MIQFMLTKDPDKSDVSVCGWQALRDIMIM